jgi:outer membrane scaffolding protein for murein synthesis (MipA/OmpV family)
VFLILCAPLAALGQSAPADDTLIGAGVRARPAYDGAASQTIEAIPVLRCYGKPWFARTTQGVLEGGARIEPGTGFALGAQIAYEGGRSSSESAFLKHHNVENIGIGASVGVHGEFDRKFGPMPMTLLGRIRLNNGAQADLRITAGVYGSGRLNAAVFAQATWANGRSVQTHYGITPQQSAATGLPAYDAASGLLFATLGLQWGFDLSREWVLVGAVEARQLHGDAAGSPLVEDRTNMFASAGLAYRF